MLHDMSSLCGMSIASIATIRQDPAACDDIPEPQASGSGGTLRQMILISEPVCRQRQEPSASSAHTSSGFSLLL